MGYSLIYIISFSRETMKIELIEKMQYSLTSNSLIHLQQSYSYHKFQNYQQYYYVSYSEEILQKNGLAAFDAYMACYTAAA